MLYLRQPLLALALLATATVARADLNLPIEKSASAFDKDRQSILSMLGDYRAGFHFQETVELDPDYVRLPAKGTGGNEAGIHGQEPGHKTGPPHRPGPATGALPGEAGDSVEQ